MKPYYERGEVRLYHGDCLEVLADVRDGIDSVVSDPPYGIAYAHSGSGKGKHSRRNTAPIAGDGVAFDPRPFLDFPEVILWGANHYANLLPHGRWLVWDKLALMAEFDNFSDVEIAWQNVRAKDKIFRHLWKGICQDSEKSARREHPTQKPIMLMAWCLSLVKGHSILDPFMGSGTTGVACAQLGRAFTGIELEEKYIEIAACRIDAELDKGRLFSAAELEPARQMSFGDTE